MTKAKIFWITFAATMALFVPIYLVVYTLKGAQANSVVPQTVTQQQSGVLITNPTPDDTKNILLMSGESGAAQAQSYALIQFDAVNNTIAVTSMPPETIVLSNGSGIMLKDAVSAAGPSQGAKALSSTLGIDIKDYIFASPQLLWQEAQIFGNISLLLANYVQESVLEEMGFVNVTSKRYTLTPLLFTQLLSNNEIESNNIHEIRSLGYSAFLAAGHGDLSDIITTLIKDNSKNMATNINANKIFEYERTLEFIDKQQPTYIAQALPGTWSQDKTRFELNEETLQFMRDNFGANEIEFEASEDDLEPLNNPEQDSEFIVENPDTTAQTAINNEENIEQVDELKDTLQNTDMAEEKENEQEAENSE